MMYLLILALFWGFCCGVIGVAVVGIFANEDIPNRMYFGRVQEWHERGGWWAFISSPIGGCVVCTSGQLALWTHFAMAPGNLFHDLLAGCSGVLCAFAVNKAYTWWNNKI